MSEHRLGLQDAGRTVEVAAGDRLLLALPENAGTGYTWQVEALPEGARVVEERYDHGAGSAIGAAAEHVFVVEVTAPGTLRLHLGRPWEGDAGMLERYEVTAVLGD